MAFVGGPTSLHGSLKGLDEEVSFPLVPVHFPFPVIALQTLTEFTEILEVHSA